MQKETKEMLCACFISFITGVLITLIVFGCANHMTKPRFPHKCPYARQMMKKEMPFKHHNKLIGRIENTTSTN